MGIQGFADARRRWLVADQHQSPSSCPAVFPASNCSAAGARSGSSARSRSRSAGDPEVTPSRARHAAAGGPERRTADEFLLKQEDASHDPPARGRPAPVDR